MRYRIENLGVQARENVYNVARLAVDPSTGHEVGVVCNFVGGGFTVFDLQERTARTIASGHRGRTCRNLAIGPDGAVYQLVGQGVCRWDWQCQTSDVLAVLDLSLVFTIDVAPDGRVYLPVYAENTMRWYDPATDATGDFGDYNDFGLHVRNVICGGDGLVYVNCTDHHRTVVVALDPSTGVKRLVAHPERPGESFPMVHKDGRGRVVVPYCKWGRNYHLELRAGRAEPVEQQDVMLASDAVESSQVAFSDGSYITAVDDQTLHFVNAAGEPDCFDFRKEGSALDLFSVTEGDGRIWCSSILPLRLISYDLASGEPTFHGDPVQGGGGEIYSMLFSRRKLFMASYGHAKITRLAVAEPWRQDNTVRSNPGYLGDIKPGRHAAELLHRPRGRALAPDGTVFFAAMGGYGCLDSGVCRIDPDTEVMVRWLFRDRVFDALVYLPAADQLLVSDVRNDERRIRFTMLCAQSGEVVRDEPVIDDAGAIIDWLHDGGDLVYGLHNHRATIFAYSLRERRIVRQLPELGLGDHCYNTFLFGPDGRIWGLTNQCVYAVDRDLAGAEPLCRYDSVPSFYRFGMCLAADGRLYFPNGPSLMRMTWQDG